MISLKLFEKNVGKTDKMIRLILGIVALVGAYLTQPIVSYVLGLIGVILIFTAIIGSCTLYTILGINTNKSSKENKTTTEKKSKKKKRK